MRTHLHSGTMRMACLQISTHQSTRMWKKKTHLAQGLSLKTRLRLQAGIKKGRSRRRRVNHLKCVSKAEMHLTPRAITFPFLSGVSLRETRKSALLLFCSGTAASGRAATGAGSAWALRTHIPSHSDADASSASWPSELRPAALWTPGRWLCVGLMWLGSWKLPRSRAPPDPNSDSCISVSNVPACASCSSRPASGANWYLKGIDLAFGFCTRASGHDRPLAQGSLQRGVLRLSRHASTSCARRVPCSRASSSPSLACSAASLRAMLAPRPGQARPGLSGSSLTGSSKSRTSHGRCTNRMHFQGQGCHSRVSAARSAFPKLCGIGPCKRSNMRPQIPQMDINRKGHRVV